MKLLAFILAALLLSGCAAPEEQPETLSKVLIDTETLLVAQKGAEISISDLAGQKQYVFITKRIRRSEALTEPYRAVETATISIDILPGGGLTITDFTAGKKYTLKPKTFEICHERRGDNGKNQQ